MTSFRGINNIYFSIFPTGGRHRGVSLSWDNNNHKKWFQHYWRYRSSKILKKYFLFSNIHTCIWSGECWNGDHLNSLCFSLFLYRTLKKGNEAQKETGLMQGHCEQRKHLKLTHYYSATHSYSLAQNKTHHSGVWVLAESGMKKEGREVQIVRMKSKCCSRGIQMKRLRNGRSTFLSMWRKCQLFAGEHLRYDV